MFTLTKTVKFAAAHHLPDHKGKCKNPHGHTWEIRVRLTRNELNQDGMVVDFGEIKKLIMAFDHKDLNEMVEFSVMPPTAENIARFIAKELVFKWPGEFDTIAVTVIESEGSEVVYSVSGNNWS